MENNRLEEQKSQPLTSVLQESGRSASVETFVLYLKSVLRFEFSAKNPLPRKAENRCASV